VNSAASSKESAWQPIHLRFPPNSAVEAIMF
jgi:hypothetical protein